MFIIIIASMLLWVSRLTVSLVAPVRLETTSLQPTQSRKTDLRPRYEFTFETILWPYDTSGGPGFGGAAPDVFMTTVSASPSLQTAIQNSSTPPTATLNPAPSSVRLAASESATSQPNDAYTDTHSISVIAAVLGSVVGIILCAVLCRSLMRSGVCRRGGVERDDEGGIVDKENALVVYEENKTRETRVLDIRKGFPFSRFSDSSSEGTSLPSTSNLSLFDSEKHKQMSTLKKGSRVSTSRRLSPFPKTFHPNDIYYSLRSATSTRLETIHKNRDGCGRKSKKPQKSTPACTSGTHTTRPHSGKSTAESEWDVAQAYGAPRLDRSVSVNVTQTGNNDMVLVAE